ncbi:MAG: serine hydrolase domain-containing protein [Hyphomonas sp.]
MLAACASPPRMPEAFAPPAEDAALFPEAAATALRAALAGDDYPKTTSVLIVRDGETIFEAYAGTGAPDKLNDTRSATKTIAALAVGIAIAEGDLASADALVWPLLEARAPAGAGDALTRAITVRDLMTMTSALHCDDNNDTPGQEEYMYPEDSWTAFALGLPSEPDWARAEDGLGPWRYCTAGSFLLGQVLEAATGEPVDQYVRTRLFEPLGIARAQWDQSPSGEFQTGGGLELASTDLAKLGWMMTDGGRWQGKQVVPEGWIREMTTIRRPAFEGMSYGYQIWERSYATPCGPVEAWFMAGNGGNHVLSFPALNAAVVLTREAYNTRGMHPQSFDLVERFVLPALACGAP